MPLRINKYLAQGPYSVLRFLSFDVELKDKGASYS